MAPRGRLTLESERQKKKKPKHVLGEQEELAQGRDTLYVLKTGSFLPNQPPNEASCTKLLNPNIEGFFFFLLYHC